ncbi:striatin Pro11 [Polyplosphaeria fusca]|uniref:Striatin Pro11 n=1 Tax=Polyplosphaeria fusca TaxID=682080 RepID=A0A9P4R4D5_9PLEO|nr:striatin Pro11 [Polyplosphaeria fusca]
MAWQSPSVMNAGGAAGGGDGGGPTGTEYTLQGVMRFLQLEWHNHERARNAWDIERAEMKAKIAKQEGEVRSAKKLNDQLNKHIRMLEQALLAERNKSKPSGDAKDESKDAKGKAAARADLKSTQNKHHNSFLDIEGEPERSEADRDALREKSKLYLTKCVEEITYLLTPPAQPPPPQPGLHTLGNGAGFMNHGDASMEEMYLQHRPRQQPQLPTAPNTSMSNHQAPSIPAVSDIHNIPPHSQPPQAPSMTREPSGQQQFPIHSSDFFGQQQQQPQAPQHFATVPEEHVERITHAYDNQGRQIQSQAEDNQITGQVTERSSERDDQWNFGDNENENENETMIQPDAQPPRRQDTESFPTQIPTKSPPRGTQLAHRRKSSGTQSRRRSEGHDTRQALGQHTGSEQRPFNVRFALRGHLDVVRSVIFTGGGSPAEPEICTAGDDGMIKRWIIPASYVNQHGMNNDLDIQPYWSHRGHEGIVTSLAACPASASFATGGRVSGDGWIFSGGQDATIRVWERGRVDPKATLDGHTDTVWTVCVLPATCATVFGQDCNNYGGPDRILLASGSADGTIKLWAVSAPPQIVSPQTGSRRGVGGSRRHSVTSGSNYPSSPQPSIATTTPFRYMLIHTIERATHPSPTCINPLSLSGDNLVVSFSDASILVYDTRTGEEIVGMASTESYNGTPATGVNAVVATTQGAEGSVDTGRGLHEEEGTVHGPTGSSNSGGVEGVVMSGHEDSYIKLYDANSGQNTYSMIAHPSAISSLSLSKDGREAVSGGHDGAVRFWSMDKRICTQDIDAHSPMRGEGACSVVWSQDGRLVVSGGGDGVVKVFAR